MTRQNSFFFRNEKERKLSKKRRRRGERGGGGGGGGGRKYLIFFKGIINSLGAHLNNLLFPLFFQTFNMDCRRAIFHLTVIASILFCSLYIHILHYIYLQFTLNAKYDTMLIPLMGQKQNNVISPIMKENASATKERRNPDVAVDTFISDFHPELLIGLPVKPRQWDTKYKNPCWTENKLFLCLPYVFLAGFPKSATSDLYEKLVWHPEIVERAKNKRMGKGNNWWTRGRYKQSAWHDDMSFIRDWSKEPASVIRNHSNYITVDASTSTIWDNNALSPQFGDTKTKDPTFLTSHFIHSEIPSAKCVVIVRNPVQRLYSDYLYFRRKRQEKDKRIFHEKAKDAVTRFNNCLKNPDLSTMHCVYANTSKYDFLGRLRIGLYYFHIRSWLAAFPKDQLLVIRMEDYSRDTASTLQNVYSFLGVKYLDEQSIQNYISQTKPRNANEKSYVDNGDMLDETKEMLMRFYRPYNAKLAEILNDEKYMYDGE